MARWEVLRGAGKGRRHGLCGDAGEGPLTWMGGGAQCSTGMWGAWLVSCVYAAALERRISCWVREGNALPVRHQRGLSLGWGGAVLGMDNEGTERATLDMQSSRWTMYAPCYCGHDQQVPISVVCLVILNLLVQGTLVCVIAATGGPGQQAQLAPHCWPTDDWRR